MIIANYQTTRKKVKTLNKREAIESYKEWIVAYKPLFEGCEMVQHNQPSDENNNHVLITFFDNSYKEHINPSYWLKVSVNNTITLYPHKKAYTEKISLSTLNTDIENSLMVKRSIEIMESIDYKDYPIQHGKVLAFL